MSQVLVCSTTAHGRPSWRALRPLLILGGFVAIWWALMTGVAHAATDQAPRDHGLDAARTTAKAHLVPVRELARRVHHEAKATTSRTTAPVRHQVRPATRTITRTVTSVAKSTPVAARAEQAVRTTVSDTVATTRKVLDGTAAGPVENAVDEVVKSSTGSADSSTVQGNSPKSGHHAQASATSIAGLLAWPAGTGGQTSGDTDSTATSASGETPAHGPPGAPTLPDPCTSPSGSGSSSSFTPAGVIESSLLVMPSVVRDLRTWRLARLPGGPAYQPGCSPD